MMVCVYGREALNVTYSRGTRESLAFTLPRLRLDHLLLEHARSRGAEIVEGFKVTETERDSHGFTVTGVAPSGDTQTWRTRILVGADGLQSVVARTQGVRSSYPWPHRLGLITHYRLPRPIADFGVMHVGSGLYVGLAPLPSDGAGSLVNVGLVMTTKSARALGQARTGLLEAGLAQLPEAGEFLRSGSHVKRTKGVALIHRKVDRASGDGFLLVGDAAGFLDPFTGEGIYRALRSSELAAHVIRGAMNQRNEELPNLRTYDGMRQAEFSGKSRFTWAIQGGLSSPGVFAFVSRRVQSSPSARLTVGNALGDIGAAGQLASPRFLASALAGV